MKSVNLCRRAFFKYATVIIGFACLSCWILLPTRTTTLLAQLGHAHAERQVLIVSSHMGRKFMGIREMLIHNKRRFCAEVGAVCILDDFEFEGMSDVPKDGNHNRRKYELLLGAWQVYPDASLAVWVDGDSWMNYEFGKEAFKLLLREVGDHDMIVGFTTQMDFATELIDVGGGMREARMERKSETGVCVLGINAGSQVFRRSNWTFWFLQHLSSLPGWWSDQCVINRLLAHNVSFDSHVRKLDYSDEIKLLQCRRPNKKYTGPHNASCKPCPVPIFCHQSDWLVHWAGRSRSQIIFNVWEQQMLEWMPRWLAKYGVGPWPANDYQIPSLTVFVLMLMSCTVMLSVTFIRKLIRVRFDSRTD